MRPKVLILDEDVLALELYARQLSFDCEVIISESVAEARLRLKDQSLDIMIVEPAINSDEGWELLNEIQHLKDAPRVIVCSVEDDRQAGLSLGADAYLVKPVLPETLQSLVNQLLTGNRQVKRPRLV